MEKKNNIVILGKLGDHKISYIKYILSEILKRDISLDTDFTFKIFFETQFNAFVHQLLITDNRYLEYKQDSLLAFYEVYYIIYTRIKQKS